MKPSQNGGPAFPGRIPLEYVREQGKEYPDFSESGMSLRDYFAAQSLAPFIARLSSHQPSSATVTAACASWAYEMADAMLKEREK